METAYNILLSREETMDVITDRIKELVVEELGASHDEVTLEAYFINDLGADSLDAVEMVMRAEEEFNIEISDEDAEKLLKVGDAVAYIKMRLQQ